jgi:hypothetical protein
LLHPRLDRAPLVRLAVAHEDDGVGHDALRDRAHEPVDIDITTVNVGGATTDLGIFLLLLEPRITASTSSTVAGIVSFASVSVSSSSITAAAGGGGGGGGGHGNGHGHGHAGTWGRWRMLPDGIRQYFGTG